MSEASRSRVVGFASAISLPAPAIISETARLPLVDALRAFAASTIAWHHFSLYPPLADGAMPIAGSVLSWFSTHGRVAQIFFVISGYILARTLSHRKWDGAAVGNYVISRYCRLGLPYIAAIGAAIVAARLGRGWIDESVLGAPPTGPQLLAHIVFLQDILGYKSLSTGLWFVCINFQLTLVYVAGLYLRDALAGPLNVASHCWLAWLPAALGWALAAASLFYFNLDDVWDVWAVYFFGQFFLGVLVHAALEDRRMNPLLVVYILLILAAMAYEWRVRLLITLLTGAVLYVGGKLGERGPTNRVVAYLGRTSYSLFLIHFPILIVVASVWTRNEWTSPLASLTGLLVAYFSSLALSAPFYRFVEEPAGRLSRRFV